MEGWEGKVEGDESREMMVMLKLEVARRAERIWVPIVPLALVWWVSFVVREGLFWGTLVAYSYEGNVLDVVVVGHSCG